MFGDILLGVVSFCTFISYFPQALKLVKTKTSNDLSIGTWILWVLSSFCYIIYAIFVSCDAMLVFETGLELFFCLFILMLVVIYKK